MLEVKDMRSCGDSWKRNLSQGLEDWQEQKLMRFEPEFDGIFTIKRRAKMDSSKINEKKFSHKLQIVPYLIAYKCHNQCLMS